MLSSFISRLLIALCTITVISLIILLTVIRPRYESVTIAERFTNIQRLESISIENIERILNNWSNVTRFIAGQVMEHPKEGEIVLRSTMTLHQDIIQIKISSSNQSDELVSQNTAFPVARISVNEKEWFYIRSDSILSVAWLNDSLQRPQYFVTRIQVQVESIPFVLTVVWDARQIYETFSNAPICHDHAAAVRNINAVLMRNNALMDSIDLTNRNGSYETFKSVFLRNDKWRIISKDFQSFPFSMIAAVPELDIVQPIERFVVYSAVFIIGLMLIVFIVSIVLFYRTKRTLKQE